jgi:sodium transport system permease protein
MIRATLTVFVKEFLENLRDRRTVMTALLVGPLFGPIFFSLMLQFALDRTRAIESVIEVRVLNPGGAPNLVRYLEAHQATVVEVRGDAAVARRMIEDHSAKAVLEIPADYGTRLASGAPAPLRLYADSSRNSDQRYVARIRTLVSQYSQQIATQRLALRGIDSRLLAPVVLQTIDVSTPASRALLVLGMLSFFLVLSLLTGGMYLAMDTTVGERDRGTLEPLLATPVPRAALLCGKLLATCAYMFLSLALTTTALFVALSRIDLEQFGMSANLVPLTAVQIIAVTAPLIPLLAALMTLVAAQARSTREAQAWLGLMQLVPTLPLVFASLMNLAPTLSLMAVPSLSQHFLITAVLRAEQMDPLHVLVSVLSSLALGLVLMFVAARVYRRESLLV